MHCDNVSEDEGTRSCKNIPFNTRNFTRDEKREFRLAMKLQRRREYPTIRKRDYKKINEHLYKIQKEEHRNRGAENEYAN